MSLTIQSHLDPLTQLLWIQRNCILLSENRVRNWKSSTLDAIPPYHVLVGRKHLQKKEKKKILAPLIRLQCFFTLRALIQPRRLPSLDMTSLSTRLPFPAILPPSRALRTRLRMQHALYLSIMALLAAPVHIAPYCTALCYTSYHPVPPQAPLSKSKLSAESNHVWVSLSVFFFKYTVCNILLHGLSSDTSDKHIYLFYPPLYQT